MIKDEEVFRIGTLGRTHGVKGELNFQFTDDVFDRVDADYLILKLDGILVPFFIDEYRFRSNSTALILFTNINTNEKAKNLVGTDVFFPFSLSDRDKEDVLDFNDLVGFTIEGVGEIISIDDYTDNVLFEVKNTEGRQMLIPAVDELVEDIDYENKKIRMNLPKGLVDLN